jgi:protein gp37
MAKTAIEWTDKVWNPVTGCTKVSQGCKNCYAETIAGRFWAKQYPKNEDGSDRQFTNVRLHPERLDQPLKWKKPQKVFVNSMSDLFHKNVPFEFIAYVYGFMAVCPQHTFQVLTKRPERMLEFYEWSRSRYTWVEQPLDNVWVGVSVEDQANDWRIEYLLDTPAAVRFVSYEPALGPLDLNVKHALPCPCCKDTGWGKYRVRDLITGRSEIASGYDAVCDDCGASGVGAPRVDWVIAGCESGPKARPAELDWFRSLRDQCQAAGVPFFLKQMMVDGKMKKYPELDGKTWKEFPNA